MSLIQADHEEALIRSFILPARQQRYLDQLNAPRRRRAFIGAHLQHMVDLDPRYSNKLDPARRQVPHDQRKRTHMLEIYAQLRSRGAPDTCRAISTNSALDGAVLGLLSALEAVVGQHRGTLLSCLPGRLAYYEGEDRGERYILQR